MQDVTHLLNRTAFGARPGDLERVQKIGAEKYLEEQLHPPRVDDQSTDALLVKFPTLRMSAAELLEKYQRPAQLRQGRQETQTPQFRMRRLAETPQLILQELQAQKIVRAVHSQRQLQEVMTDFWFNHFNVFWNKNADRWLTTPYEMDVIRPHALGKFK